MPFDGKAFGRRVRAARVWAGIEPKELAARLDRTDEAIYQIERGDRKRKPKRDELNALARELGQDPEWLLSGETPPWATDPSERDGDLAAAIAAAVAAFQAVLGQQAELQADQQQLAAQLTRLADRLEQLDSERAPRSTARGKR